MGAGRAGRRALVRGTLAGLKPKTTDYRATIHDNDFLARMYERCRPHYEALAAHKLGAV